VAEKNVFDYTPAVQEIIKIIKDADRSHHRREKHQKVGEGICSGQTELKWSS
jgi:hypothetical protein